MNYTLVSFNRFFGIPMNILPEIRSCSEVYGHIVSPSFYDIVLSNDNNRSTYTLSLYCCQADGPLKGTPICGVSCSDTWKILSFHKFPLSFLFPLLTCPLWLQPLPLSPALSLSFLFSLFPRSFPSPSLSVLVTSRLPW